MKSLFTLLLLCVSLFALKVETKIESAIRADHNRSGAIITNAAAGAEFVVLDTFGDYINVLVVDGTNAGKKGWVTERAYSEGKIIGQGCALRTAPDKTSEAICFLKAGTTVKILGKKITWYKVAGGKFADFLEGWISAFNVREIK